MLDKILFKRLNNIYQETTHPQTPQPDSGTQLKRGWEKKMGWIHAGNSEGGSGSNRGYTAALQIKTEYEVSLETAQALVGILLIDRNVTLEVALADADYIHSWLSHPNFIQYVNEIYSAYEWKKVRQFLEWWIVEDYEFNELVRKCFPVATTATKSVDYEALYEAKYGVNLRDKAENGGDWYIDEVYPLSLNDWAKVQLEAVSF